ncbi:hypothetical protein P8C59_008662 [Phyllachora maydis]|uniref:Uncharacterized protein n=1 Tax=Phyllachora maydis TaxID=1825666 RepID=A0AAD9IBW1_9PEZI|nr:hypothetical protein P8C59_008662 [Phyllachora maydis]
MLYCFTNLLIADIDSLFNLDNSVYNIPDKYFIIIRRIPATPLAPAPIPAKPAKITPAIRRTAACKAKQRKSAKAHTIAYKLAKKKDLRRSKRTASGNAGRYTTNSGLIADKDNDNAYNRAYVPPANTEEEEEEEKEEEEEEDSSSNNNSINSSTSNSTNKGKGSGAYKRGKGASRRKDILLYK